MKKTEEAKARHRVRCQKGERDKQMEKESRSHAADALVTAAERFCIVCAARGDPAGLSQRGAGGRAGHADAPLRIRQGNALALHRAGLWRRRTGAGTVVFAGIKGKTGLKAGFPGFF